MDKNKWVQKLLFWILRHRHLYQSLVLINTFFSITDTNNFIHHKDVTLLKVGRKILIDNSDSQVVKYRCLGLVARSEQLSLISTAVGRSCRVQCFDWFVEHRNALWLVEYRNTHFFILLSQQNFCMYFCAKVFFFNFQNNYCILKISYFYTHLGHIKMEKLVVF